jgi:Multicopper oxidase
MLFSSLLLASLTLTGVFATKALSKRCTNSASDRSCWGDYDLSTNYYDTVPDTGVTREYWFDIQNGTAAPDGVERIVLTVNGSFPGPTIITDWGDTVSEYAVYLATFHPRRLSNHVPNYRNLSHPV